MFAWEIDQKESNSDLPDEDNRHLPGWTGWTWTHY